MDSEKIRQMVAELIEQQKQGERERVDGVLADATRRETELLKQIEELKAKNENKNSGKEKSPILENDVTGSQSSSQLSKLPMLIEIEPFEPSEDAEDEDGSGKFDEWLKRFQFLLDCAAPDISDRDKVKFLMTRLSKEAFSEYNKMCLPRDITDFSYAETVTRLHELFEPPAHSLFADRYECLRIVKDEAESFRNYFQRVKIALRRFNFSELTEEQFSCLVALAGIRERADDAARTAILQRLNADGANVRYEQVVSDCLNLLKVREAADSSLQRFARRGRRARKPR